MSRPKAKAPARSYHISGQSIVRIDGKDYYLGKHDSPESIARYAVLIGIYQKHGLSLPQDFNVDCMEEMVSVLLGHIAPNAATKPSCPITVAHVAASYRDHIKTKYKHSPQDSQRHERLCEILEEHYADIPAVDFGPLKLAELREYLTANGLRKSEVAKHPSRGYVNRLVGAVVSIFNHAVSKELVPVDKVLQLRTLETLKYGQTEAPEGQEREPVNLMHVRTTAAFLPPIVRAMLRVQVSTGMRPKEIFTMRPCDIDRSGAVWIYTPASHKTKHKGKRRAIPIVGDAREAIIDYLARDPESCLFSPAETLEWMRAKATAKRVTPIGHGNRPGTHRVENPKKKPGTQYTAHSYRQAIQRAAKAAKVPAWHPYQLRHTTATAVRNALRLEDAQALLGHSTALTTANYARESIESATRAANVAPKL